MAPTAPPNTAACTEACTATITAATAATVPAAPTTAAPAAPAPQPPPAPVHLPSLATGLLVMLVGTLYPPLMADAAGRADHGLAMALFWAMSAGFVRGVGFVPRLGLWQLLFSGWACAAAAALALVLKLQH